MDKDKLLYELLEKVDVLTKRLAELESEVSTLKAENIQLKARLNRNSYNSNQPPSGDGYKKQAVLPKEVKGAKGGQTGHKGSNLKQIENPDFIIECKPENCSCGQILANENFELAEKRQDFDLPKPRLEVTEYQLYKAKCPKCGLAQKGIAPEGITGAAQYGKGIKAFAFKKEVPFTNNLADRDIRPAKLKLKISNCFRTSFGADMYARIEGFLSTARKRNKNVFLELSDTFNGYNSITA